MLSLSDVFPRPTVPGVLLAKWSLAPTISSNEAVIKIYLVSCTRVRRVGRRLKTAMNGIVAIETHCLRYFVLAANWALGNILQVLKTFRQIPKAFS